MPRGGGSSVGVLPVAYCRCFSPRGLTPTSEFVCVLPFPDGDAKRHKDLSWFGQEKALRPADEGEFVLFCT